MPRLLRTLAPAFALAAASLCALPASAQEGVLMKNILGNLGILPDGSNEIEYRERPTLVVPKDTSKLPAPEKPVARGKANWPHDPDVAAREAARNKSLSSYIAPSADPVNGARLSPSELAKARTSRQKGDGEPYRFSDKAGVRLSVQEMGASGTLAADQKLAHGTEPPRQYLTDPPVGTRLPSTAAPVGRTTFEGRVPGNDRPSDAWKRLD